ncbi:MAG TPA: hypothetical protein VGN34_26755 [Ktedonobacteraceae bacterium]|jgi:hypothetical protein
MAKAKTRKRGTGRGGSVRSRSGRTAQATTAPLLVDTADEVALAGSHTTRVRKSSVAQLGAFSSSGVLMTGMVTLGCWGMMIFFFFLYPDPNHVLFGCFAAFMALIWSYSFSVRLRKLLRRT